MALKQIIVAIDEHEESLKALYFSLSYFAGERNHISILWLGKHEGGTDNDPEVIHFTPSLKLGGLPANIKTHIFEMVNEGFKDMEAHLTVMSMDHFTRKQITSVCSFSDVLVATYPTFSSGIQPLFERFIGGRKYNKVCCPKILLSNSFEALENVVLVKTDQVNTIATVKQFCHVFGDYCTNAKLNVLDLQEYSDHGGFLNAQKMLVDYLKQHASSPALFSYSGEDFEHLRDILNLDNNTIWVSPLESVEELKFMQYQDAVN